MLKKKWPNGITGDEGFEIWIEGKGTIIYSEGVKRLSLNSEYAVGGNEIVVYQDSIKGWQKFVVEAPFSLLKQEEIIENVRRALAIRGIKLQVIKSGLQPMTLFNSNR